MIMYFGNWPKKCIFYQSENKVMDSECYSQKNNLVKLILSRTPDMKFFLEFLLSFLVFHLFPLCFFFFLFLFNNLIISQRKWFFQKFDTIHLENLIVKNKKIHILDTGQEQWKKIMIRIEINISTMSRKMMHI